MELGIGGRLSGFQVHLLEFVVQGLFCGLELQDYCSRADKECDLLSVGMRTSRVNPTHHTPNYGGY